MNDENKRLKEWRSKLKKDPKKMKDWSRAVYIGQMIILINLIAFCCVMAFLILVKWTEPDANTPLPTPEASTVFERAQKYD